MICLTCREPIPWPREDCPARGTEHLLYYREAPHDDYLVFVPPERALFVDQIHHAIQESTTWGEFRRRMPASEYQRLFEDIFSTDPDVLVETEDAHEPADEELFTSDCVPGFSDGDYPPWLAPEQDSYLPSELLREFATQKESFLNGGFWALDPARAELIVKKLQSLGYTVERRDDLNFW